MEVVLENRKFKVIIDSLGAQLKCFYDKENKIEHIWCQDPKFWGRSSPILFPHVGRVKNDTLNIKGVTYKSGQHGFARDEEFKLEKASESKAEFLLTQNETTLARYPYSFMLTIGYELKENELNVYWKVTNTNNERMYFGIGGHPAFNVPLEQGLGFEDYFFEITPTKVRKRIPFVIPMLDPMNAYDELVDKIAIKRNLFHNDALVYETSGPTTISIQSEKSTHSITMKYDSIPFVGLWSMYPDEAPFVCVEPWSSYADTPEDDGLFEHKHSVQTLEAHQSYETNYTLIAK